jgi:SAM-dependent methyltransferase
MTETLTSCPLCGGKEFEQFLTVKDYFLTGESFKIFRCIECGFKFVNPRPTYDEIGKYYQSDAYISHNSAGFSLFNWAYRVARYFAIRKKYGLVRHFTKGERLLDIGCGTGELLKYCKRKGFVVQGVEPNESPRKYAIEQNGIDVKSSLTELSGGVDDFDCIMLWHVLEHIHSLNTTLDDIKRILNKEGLLVIAVPNHESFDAKFYNSFWAGYDVPRHLYHFTRDSIFRFADKHGFVVQNVFPQKMDSYYVSFLSEKYKDGSSSFLSAVINGWKSNHYARRPGMGYSSLIFLLSHKKG